MSSPSGALFSLAPEVRAALGEEKAFRFSSSVDALLALADSVPPWTISATLLPVALQAKTAMDATREVTERLSGVDPDEHWMFATAARSDGTWLAKATPFLSADMPASRDWFTRFVLSELHPRLSAWWLTEVWRAAELALGTVASIGEWRVLVAAATARSLLEGAAALYVATPQVEKLWSDFKLGGEPSLRELERFADEFGTRVTTLQYSTRVDQDKRKGSPLISTNVLTLIQKLSKATPDADVIDTYEWLCDAVHPSFGSRTTFTVIRATHDTGTHLIEHYARHPLGPMARSGYALVPTVAHAVVDATAVAATVLVRDLERLRWIIEDFGLTTGVSFELTLDYFGKHSSVLPASVCPCGSGRTFEACVHRWGHDGSKP